MAVMETDGKRKIASRVSPETVRKVNFVTGTSRFRNCVLHLKRGNRSVHVRVDADGNFTIEEPSRDQGK